MWGIKQGDSPVDCARMLAEEFGKDNICVAADVKDVFKYGINFRNLTPKDQIYVNKLHYRINQEINENNSVNSINNMSNMKVLANAKKQTR